MPGYFRTARGSVSESSSREMRHLVAWDALMPWCPHDLYSSLRGPHLDYLPGRLVNYAARVIAARLLAIGYDRVCGSLCDRKAMATSSAMMGLSLGTETLVTCFLPTMTVDIEALLPGYTAASV